MSPTSVTVVMPMRNEAAHIAQCLDSVLENGYPHDRLEILVVDGMSTDGSREIVDRYAARHPSVRLLDNPRRTISCALNIGIREAANPIVVRMDSHSLYEPGYIQRSVELLESSGAAVLGGCQRAEGANYFGRAVAAALGSRFAAGDARYRYARGTHEVETVYLGAWRRDTLFEFEGFREDWLVNEDYELNHRLRAAGRKVLLCGDISSRYRPRSSAPALAKQYARYGFWRAKTLLTHRKSLRWRQMAAPLLVLSLGVSAALAPLSLWPLAAVAATYGATAVAAAVRLGARTSPALIPALAIVFPIIHLAWGIGFISGVVWWRALGVAAETDASLKIGWSRPS
jgi:succinoglycan biosynthesis protein ExoA